jgi:hypothetical protein
LWIEARGKASSLDQAASAFTAIARMIATVVGFTANTQVGMPEVHLGYDVTAGQSHRDFMEVFLPDERGLPREGRHVEPDELVRVVDGLGKSDESLRLLRALGQYGLALRHWHFGGEWLALAHLYMAVETLTPAVIRSRCARDSITEEDLLSRLGLEDRPKLEAWARREIIFGGDNETYRNARRASDGVEHGFLELDEVHKHAHAETSKVFAYVRHIMLDLLGFAEAGQPDLYRRGPRDVQSLRRIIRGQLVGDGSDPAPTDVEYPFLTWNSSVKVWERNDDNYELTVQDQFTVRCAASYSFLGTALEFRGRNEPGSPFQLDPVHEVKITRGSPSIPEALTLMRQVHRFAEDVTAHGVTLGVPPLLTNIFGMAADQLGQFEAVETLLRQNQPAEAIIFGGNLVRGACRLQAIANHPNPVGVAVRIRLDSIARLVKLHADEETLAEKAAGQETDLHAAAAAAGIMIESAEPDYLATPYYAESAKSLAFSREVAQGDDLAAALHAVTDDTGARALNTRIADDNLIRRTAAQAAEALITASIAIATILGWPFDDGAANTLLATARRVGEGT